MEISKKEIRILKMLNQKNANIDTRIKKEALTRLLSAGLVVEMERGSIQITPAGQALLRRHDILKKMTKQTAGDMACNTDLANNAVFRAQHQELNISCRIIDGERKKVLVNRSESPLGWLLSRKDKAGNSLISHRQYDAGERLRVDFELAGIERSITSRWDGLPIGGGHQNGGYGLDPSDVQIMARRRFNDAIEMLGAGMSDVAVRVCCYLEGLSECEKTLGWPIRSGKLVLAMALDRLCDHYKIKNNQIG